MFMEPLVSKEVGSIMGSLNSMNNRMVAVWMSRSRMLINNVFVTRAIFALVVQE